LIKKLFLILAILFIAVPSFAANHYINAACSSGCDGTTWAKGWATFGDVTWTRGDTYYVAGGTYNESPIITKAESGASWIIIKKANAADNGGDPGWNASYASDVAQINGTLYIDSSYIEVNGVTGSANSGHGIKVNFQSDCGTYEVPGYAIQLTWDIKEIYLHHIEALACSSTSNKQTRGVSFNSAGSTNSKKIHLQHMFIHDVTENVHTFLGVNGTSWEDYGLLVEDSFTEDVGLSPIVEVHCQVFQFGPGSTQSYIIIRNNTFHDPFGGISFLGGSTSDYVRIYNNIFATTQPDLYMVSPGAIWSHANVGTSVSNIEIYNNVFYNMSPAAALSFQSPTTINITARNNIWENSVFASGYIGVDVSTNNGYFGNTGGGIPSGETGQINGASTTFTSPTTYDFTLKSDGYALNGGYDLSSIFTGDIDGNTRTVPWDIGAYEYGEDTTPPVISNILPSGVQQCDAASPVDITLSVTTNENATCKYDTSDTTYDLMANTYGTTGTTSHSQVISLACDDSYTYYTRCMDASPQQNKNLTSATHTFSIGPPEGVDATPL